MKFATAFLLTLAALASLPALAEPPQYRHWSVNAPALCHPAFLRYDSDVRKRPLAVVNEGNAPAFVTCSLPIDMANTNGIEVAYIVLHNQANAPATVSCTGVYGSDNGQQDYVTTSVEVGAGQRRRLELVAENFGRVDLRNRIGFSCRLPVMTGVNEIGTEEKL